MAIKTLPTGSKTRAKSSASKKSKKVDLKYVVDCTQPVEDAIMDIDSFRKFVIERMKIGGKTHNLKDHVTVKAINPNASGKLTALEVNSLVAVPKRYIKYMTKKYLSNMQLRNWVRVLTKTRNSYEIRYYNLSQ